MQWLATRAEQLFTDDLDQDGDTDLIVRHANPTRIEVLLGDGSGGFS